MTMTRLIVKGTRSEAEEAARRFGLTVDWQHATRFGEQVLVTTSQPEQGAVSKWFHDAELGGWHSPIRGARKGYPPGTLLWYRLPAARALLPYATGE